MLAIVLVLLILSCVFLIAQMFSQSINKMVSRFCRYIGMSLYNVLFLCVIGVPVSLVTRQTPDASFAIVSTCVIACTSITMCLVFIPKVLTCLVHF